MTVSAPSSSIVLLTSPVDPARSAVPADEKPSGDAAGDGFQLLLAQAADGLFNVSGAAPAPAKGTVKDSAESDAAPAADGNTLPPLIDILPLPQAAPAARDGEVKAEAKHPGKTGEDKTEDASTDAATLLPALAAMPQPAAPNPAPAVAEAPADTQAITLGAASVIPQQTQKKADPAQAGKNAANADMVAGAADSAPAATAVAAAATDNSGGDGAAQQGRDSDFDTLIKQLDTASASNSSTAAVDTGRAAPAQAARPYAPANPPGHATATVSVPVASDGWHDAVADKVMWFSANKISSAEIHLNPPDLGPIQVRINTQQDQATVYFTSQHASVRDALDQALPRLRDMMGGQGIQLADAGVGGQGSARQQEYRGNPDAQARPAAGGFFREAGDSAEPVAVSSVAALRGARSAIDAYA